MRKLWLAALCATTLALTVSQAAAETVTVTFDISNLNFDAAAAAEFGLSQGPQSFSGTWTYDNTSVVSGLFLTDVAAENLIQSFDLTIGNTSFDKSSIELDPSLPWVKFDTHGDLEFFVFDIVGGGAIGSLDGGQSGGSFDISRNTHGPFCNGCVSFSLDPDQTTFRAGGPEPASWALMITGFGMAGGALRRRRAALA